MSEIKILQGEIVIPLENTISLNPSENIDPYSNITDIFKKDIKAFRAVIFQNEFLRFFVILKLNQKLQQLDNEYINQYIHKLDILIQINSNNENTDDEEQCKYYNYNGEITTEIKKDFSKNINFEKSNYITRYNIIKEKDMIILELKKVILVSDYLINKNSILTVKIYSKKDCNKINIFESDTNNKEICTIIYKDIKVVRPLILSKISQFDYSQDISIIQIKIENITSKFNYIDNTLFKSSFFNLNKIESVYYGMTYQINDIINLKDETFLLNKMIINMQKREQVLLKEQLPIQLREINIESLGNVFPFIINPGEVYNLNIKLEKSHNFYNTIDMTIFTKSQTEKDVKNIEKNTEKGFSANILNLFNNNNTDNSLSSSKTFTSDIFKKKNIKIPFLYNFEKSNIVHQSTESNIILNSSNNIDTSKDMNIDTENKYDNIDQNNIIKLHLCTPILLTLNSKEDYENIYMKIFMDWNTDIANQLKIQFQIDEEQYPYQINKILNIKFIFKNLSNSLCKYELEFKYSLEKLKEYVESNDYNINTKQKWDDSIPDIISESENVIVGNLQPKEEKKMILKFMPLKSGYINLPSFYVHEKKSKKKYFVVHYNKILIKE